MKPIHSSDRRHVDQLWLLEGGAIVPLRRTGELLYVHALFDAPVRINGRRKDTPAKVLSRLNQLRRRHAANDE